MEEFQEGIEDERKDGFGGIEEIDGVPDEEEVREALKGRSTEQAAEYLGIDVDTLNVAFAYYRHKKLL